MVTTSALALAMPQRLELRALGISVIDRLAVGAAARHQICIRIDGDVRHAILLEHVGDELPDPAETDDQHPLAVMDGGPSGSRRKESPPPCACSTAEPLPRSRAERPC